MAAVTRPSTDGSRDGTRGGPPGDWRLIEDARAGSQKAFSELVERYQTLAFTFAYTLTRSVSLSEEIAQEAFLTAWRRLPDMQRPDRFRGWLCGIVWKVGRRRQRVELSHRPKEFLAPPSPEDHLESADPSPLERVITHEEEMVIGRALGEIPDAYRAALVLYYIESYSMEEIAEVLDLTPENVRQRLSRGRKMLQDNVFKVLESGLRRLRPRKDFAAGVAAALLAATMPLPAQASPAQSTGAVARGSPRLAIGLGAGALMALSLLTNGLYTSSRSRAVNENSGAGARSSWVRPSWLLGSRPPARNTITARLAAVSPPSPDRAAQEPPDSPRPLLSFDLESDLLHPLFETGELVSANCANDSHHCVMSQTRNKWGPAVAISIYADIGIRGTNFLFTYTPRAVLSFDYRVGVGTDEILIEVNSDKYINYDYVMKDLTRGEWAHATVKLADFFGTSYPDHVLDGKDLIMQVAFYANRKSGEPFYLDNIQALDADHDLTGRPSMR